MDKKARILVVDDEAVVRDSMREWLTDAGYQVFTAESGRQALDVIQRERVSIVLADLVMPGMDGIELMKRARELNPNIAVIIMTAYGSIPTAIAAMKEGAYDYIEKPFCPERVELLIQKLVEHQNLIQENISLRQRLEDRYRFENIVAKSHKMQKVIELIKTVAKSNASVLIIGETGTGKELVARAVHSQSYRCAKPFVAVSCAALPESLLESELFGHEKGSFTGAIARRKGRFELANKGTLFLDEIGEISANIQVHLLRVLEEKEFTRVGGTEPIRVDVRLVTATNKDLKKAVERGEFREDLYYRINVVTIELPPLRERKEDIPLLANYFLSKFAQENQKDIAGFSPNATELLMNYDWPGNVRELENAIERAIILAQDNWITAAELAPWGVVRPGAVPKDLRELEREHILNVLAQTRGNYSQAARILGITRMTLYNKAKAYGIDVKKIDKETKV